ncbi:MAG: hypothetical protein R2939_22010 [Kofleriaceae bacterium]
MPDAVTPPPSPLDRAYAHLARHGHRWVLAGMTLLLAVVYRGVFRGELGGDDLGFHLAETARLSDCLRALDFDLWNPSANAGFASAYYYQVIPQLVPAALTALTGGHLLFWFQLSVFLPLVLVPAAGYRAMRVLGASAGAAVAGGGAIAMCISSSRWGHGADGTFSVGLYTQTWAFAAFPLALAYGVRWLEAGTRLGAAVGWGLFVGLCHPFAGIALGLALGVGVAVRLALTAVPWPPAAQLTTWVPWLAADELAARPRTLRSIGRLLALGALLLIGSASAWLTVVIDYDGFGGFPRRVADEVGPGLGGLWDWMTDGVVLDAARPMVLTGLLPVVLVFARARYLVWLWSAALLYTTLLAIGPHLVTPDDLFPAVRFLGPLQIVLAMAIGAGAITVGAAAWRAAERWRYPLVIRTVLAGLAVALSILAIVPGARAQAGRVHVGADLAWVHRDEVLTIAAALAAEGGTGRKQGRAGTENQWANLMPYTYGRTPALLQMGGAGLQSSPNYVYLWEERDPTRTAWIFDGPYVMFSRDKASTIPAGDTVIETEHLAVRRLPTPGLVSAVTLGPVLPAGRFAARKEAIAWVKSAAAIAGEARPYAGGPPPLPAAADGRSTGELQRAWRQPSPGDAPDIVALVTASAPTTFVVRESWHPRWRAFVDGAPATVRRVTPDFPAVDVPAGTHTISLRFDRPWWAWASWLLIPLAIATGALVSRRRAR